MFTATLVGAVMLLQVVAQADHEDVIADKIPLGAELFALEPVADGFFTPVEAAAAPYNPAQLFVADQLGLVTAIRLDQSNSDVPDRYIFLDVGPGGLDLLTPPPPPDGFDERGLLGIAFHPRYVKNGLFYTYTSEPLGPTPDFTTLNDDDPRTGDGSLSVIREWRVDEPRRRDAVVDPATSRVLLTIEQPQKNHNAGAVVFGPDAMLYIALGDGGQSDDEGVGHGPAGIGNGQDLGEGNLLGKILRIDPLGDNGVTGGYGIPPDNPFVGAPGADEIYAYGFRNPWRMSFDQTTGDLFVGDVGQRDIEEVDVVVRGGNYGWPVKEGTFLFDGRGLQARGQTTDDSPGVPAGMIDPVAQYDHDEGTSVTGGFVYRGRALPDLVGSYVFGDLTRERNTVAGRFFVLDADGTLFETVPANRNEAQMLITGFGQDTEGELYAVGLAPDGSAGPAGVVRKLVPVD